MASNEHKGDGDMDNMDTPENQVSYSVTSDVFRVNLERNRVFMEGRMDPDHGLVDRLQETETIGHIEVQIICAEKMTFMKNRQILNIILEGNASEKIKKFRQALQDTKQEHLLNYVKANGEYNAQFVGDWPLGKREIDIIDKNMTFLKRKLDTDGELLPEMRKHNIITQWQGDSVSEQPVRYDRSTALLEIIRRGSLSEYKNTIDRLEDTKQIHVAAILREGGMILQVRATTAGRIPIFREMEIVTQLLSVGPMQAKSPKEQARLPEVAQLKILGLIDAAVTESIGLFFHCKTLSEFLRLVELLETKEMQRIVEVIYNKFIPTPTKIEVTLTWNEDEFNNVRCYLEGLRTSLTMAEDNSTSSLQDWIDFMRGKPKKHKSSRQKSKPIEDWEKPRLFIGTDANGGLFVNKETEQCLEKINAPVVVVSVVELYRTGKSFILNRLSGLGQGFSLGATVESTTKGIWIWVVQHPKRDDCLLVLIDTEGLGDKDKVKLDHDLWIFALGILLSSTFVYNSKGVIDQKAINDLHFVTEVAERIKLKSRPKEDIEVKVKGGNTIISSSGSKHEELKELFPSFVWALRDCTLKLVISGKACSPDEYLEHALTSERPTSNDQQPDQEVDVKGSDRQTATKHPKDCIKEYFSQRKCFVFPIPVRNTDLMDRIDTLEDHEFHKDFLKVSDEFCEYIFTQSKVKTIFDNITTGRALARLAVIYVDSIRNGSAPCIQNAVESTARIENEQAIKESVDLYTKMFEASVTFPTETPEEMSDCHMKCCKEASDLFLKKSVFDFNRAYYLQMADKLQKAYEQFRSTNEMKSHEACGNLLSDLYKEIEAKDYSVSGGYDMYKKDMKELVDKYNKTPHMKDVATRMLDEFMKREEKIRQAILKTDTKLTEVEKMDKDLKAAQEAKDIAEKATEELLKKTK